MCARDALLAGNLNSGIWIIRGNARSRAALTSINVSAFCNANQAEQNALVRRASQMQAEGTWSVLMM